MSPAMFVYLDIERSDSGVFRVHDEFGRFPLDDAARLESVAVTIHLRAANVT